MTLVATAKRLLPTNRFARSVSILAGGTAAAQVLLVLAAPILTRLYTPEDFGLLAVFAALLAVIAVIASLRYELAIPLPEDDLEAAHVVVLSLIIVAGMAISTLVLVLAFRHAIASALNIPALAGYLWLLPLGVLLAGTYQVFNYWAIRTKAFPAIARTKLTQAASTIAVQIGGFTLGPLALILGTITGQAAGTTSLGALAVRKRWSVFRQVRLGGIRARLVRYRRFPLYSSWDALLNTVSSHLPAILFAVFFTPAAAGFYSLAHRVLAMPINLIGGAVAQVFFSDAPSATRKKNLGTLVSQTHDKLVHIGMPPALFLMLAGPTIFLYIFSDSWQTSADIVPLMMPWLFFQFTSSPLSTVFLVLERQTELLAFQSILLAIRFFSLLIGVFYLDFFWTVGIFSFSSAICYVGLLLWVVWKSDVNSVSILRSWLSACAWSSICIAPYAIVYSIGSSGGIVFFGLLCSPAIIFMRWGVIARHAW